jgi:hypothetical protein
MIPPIDYTTFAKKLLGKPHADWPQLFDKQIVPKWCTGYRQSTTAAPQIVAVTLDGFVNVFDISRQRLIGVFGLSQGKHTGARDSSRMAGHPQSAGPDYHRGHAIAHTLGGGTDINLFSQRGRLNIGEFRRLERAAVADPNALYFVRLVYNKSNSGQLPDWIEQGLFPSGNPLNVQTPPPFKN